jgi:hypothetical protein
MSRKVLVLLALCLQSSNALALTQASRRVFLETSSLAILGTAVPAFADDVDELSMPEKDAKSEVRFSMREKKKESPLFSTMRRRVPFKILRTCDSPLQGVKERACLKRQNAPYMFAEVYFCIICTSIPT